LLQESRLLREEGTKLRRVESRRWRGLGARLLHDEAYRTSDVTLYGLTTGRHERNT